MLSTLFVQEVCGQIQPTIIFILELMGNVLLGTVIWIAIHENTTQRATHDESTAQDHIAIIPLILQRHEIVEEAIRVELCHINEKLQIQGEAYAVLGNIIRKPESPLENVENINISVGEISRMLKSIKSHMDLLSDGMEILVSNELRRSQRRSYSSIRNFKPELQVEYYDVKPDEWLSM
jgi:hypothetical protein